MKIIKFFVAAALLAAGSSAHAQFTNTSGSSSSSGVGEEGWNTSWLEYNSVKMYYTEDDDDAIDFTGFSVGYSRAISLSQENPILMEIGFGMQYAYYSKNKTKLTIWTGKIPVNILYNFAIPNSNISIVPFAGLTSRFNFAGPLKNNGSNAGDIFDDGSDFNRFQIGWHVGVKVRFTQSLMAGVSYGDDFSEIAEDTKMRTTSIMVGYTF